MTEEDLTIKEELLLIQKLNGGILKPTNIVDWAEENVDSKLHSKFDWDNKVAGPKWRLWQARALIALHIVNEKGERQMLSLSIDRVNPGGGYRGLTEIMQSQPLREVLLRDALIDLERVRLKYESLTELAKVWEAVEDVKSKQKGKKKKMEPA